ncbi:MAG: glycosyltransferase [Candidatus Eisenbacteria bacterium]|nr:glycosyltransferase [Candidatus Eisenbacteria bacterium]
MSVVIPTCNKKHLLSRTLGALFSQRFDGSRFEIVVVDDGSRDGTSEILASPHPVPLVFERHAETRGRAPSRNTGILRATGEIVVFLDDDMIVGPDFIQAHVTAQGDARKRVVIGNVSTAPEANGSSVSRYLDTRGVKKVKDKKNIPPRYFLTNNSSVKREFLISVGLFDPEFVTYGFEDVDLGHRMGKVGGEFVYAENAKSFHIHRHSLDEFLEKKVLCGKSSLRILIDKHPELRKVLRLNLLECPAVGEDSWGDIARKLLLSVFLRKPFFRTGRFIAERTPASPVTFKLIDFLVFYCYAGGLKWKR